MEKRREEIKQRDKGSVIVKDWKRGAKSETWIQQKVETCSLFMNKKK